MAESSKFWKCPACGKTNLGYMGCACGWKPGTKD